MAEVKDGVGEEKSGRFKKIIMVIVGGMIIVPAIVLAILYATTFVADVTFVEAGIRNNTNFSVFYIENDIFLENPIQTTSFLRHFTDFIEIENSFSMDITEDLEIIYNFHVKKTLQIHHLGGGSSTVIFTDSAEIDGAAGTTFGNRLYFPSTNGDGEPGGTYRFYPSEYAAIFSDFLASNEYHMGGEVNPNNFRNYSAELSIEFTYRILTAPINFDQQLVSTSGYKFSIDQDVFSLESIGNSSSTASANIEEDMPDVDIIIVAALGSAVVVGMVLIFLGMRNMTVKISEFEQKTNDILKKYAGEIVVSKNPINLSGYKIMLVDDFEDILKLSVNLNKHVMCHHSSSRAEFCTVVGEYAYFYSISNGEKAEMANMADVVPIYTTVEYSEKPKVVNMESIIPQDFSLSLPQKSISNPNPSVAVKKSISDDKAPTPASSSAPRRPMR
ncbi:MAG: DUF5305 domain-containing protein [Treponema sp.]|nr:DUF5305 domain-containing protein [Treponema sp.]